MATVFISYRRDDSAGQARTLFRDLSEILGKNAVFMDVDSIALGRDFREVLQEHLASCDVMLVLIGPQWLTAQGIAGRRVDHPDDYVRQEVSAALKRKIPVTPILLQGARIPEQSQLPNDLKELAYRNGFELSHTRWDSDVRELLQRLGLRPTSTKAPKSVQASRWRIWAGGVGATAVITLLLWLSAKQWFDRTPPPNCTDFYGAYNTTLTLSSGNTSCGRIFSNRWTFAGNADCSDFRVRETGSEILFRGTISSDGKFRAAAADPTAGVDTIIEGNATRNEITGTDTNYKCTFAISGHR